MVRAELERAFPPEVDVPSRLVDDLEGMTCSSYGGLRLAGQPGGAGYRPRLRGPAADKVIVLDGVGHTPQIDDPPRAARLILDFAR